MPSNALKYLVGGTIAGLALAALLSEPAYPGNLDPAWIEPEITPPPCAMFLGMPICFAPYDGREPRPAADPKPKKERPTTKRPEPPVYEIEGDGDGGTFWRGDKQISKDEFCRIKGC